MQGNFLKWFPRLDDMLSRQQPTKADIKLLKEQVPNTRIIRSDFFDRLNYSEWISPLSKHGFFSPPPAPERGDEGRIRFPTWPESKYLVRMANEKPDLIADVILEMPDTENAAVQIVLIEAMLALPPTMAANFTEKAIKWAEAPYLLVPLKLGELIGHLAKGGKIDEAFRIARVLLDVFPNPTKGQRLQS